MDFRLNNIQLIASASLHAFISNEFSHLTQITSRNSSWIPLVNIPYENRTRRLPTLQQVQTFFAKSYSVHYASINKVLWRELLSW